MTKAEMLLAARLLEMAGESFSNHGCNDMEPNMFTGISLADRDSMAKGFEQYNGEYVPLAHIGDDSWMNYLADKLLQAAEKTSE